MILVTGGAGFIGSNFVLDWIATENTPVVNLDKLTYAGNLNNLSSLGKNSKHIFRQGDIGDRELLRSLLKQHEPRAIVHFAAESYVDRSILGPENFSRPMSSAHFTCWKMREQRTLTFHSMEISQFQFLFLKRMALHFT
jgi:dTDP-glucose 4,6-dehydratase